MKKFTEAKIALVHDILTEYGGAEKVLQNLLEIFPDADIYTSYANDGFMERFFQKLDRSKLHVSWAQKTLFFSHPSLFQCFSPLIWKSFNLYNYDIVISGPSYLLSNLINVKKALHIQYVHALPQNLIGIMPFFRLQKLLPYTQILLYLYKKALKSSSIIACSKYVNEKLSDLFGISSQVIYPPVNIPMKCPIKNKGKYFLTSSRLSPEKGIDLAIQACSKLNIPLKIAGVSRYSEYEKYLRFLAGSNIEFLGFQKSEQLVTLYKDAIALLFPSKNEDFGLSVVEAMAYGVPVIGYYSGGVKETIIPNKTGIFFYDYTAESLEKSIKSFDINHFAYEKLYLHAKKFNKERYKKQIIKFLYEKYQKS